ncbi:hypothetical protein FW774_08000 [Pedobacter sp. BS3]|uniref:DUF5689 domain-containing protein n=1 Tax=Pedobacter sp. BS3 TaxID=2567937 RepID=UPI0011EFF8D6|nr:DUF5689 domain-containing protein [Pedobacter sp. BS3]TZF84906.1 hypothetical protein FW774_08000 [Pedobacter sp. BS3]
MKKIIFYMVLAVSVAALWSGCKKGSFPGASVSPYIAIYDLRNIYKGQDVKLTADNMYGSDKITGIVVSDHSGGNLPAGLLVMQDRRRLSQLRGISIAIGSDAGNYKPGDSVIVDISGGVLKRVDGILEITGIPAAAITKVSSYNAIPVNRVNSNLIIAKPDNYESTLVAIVKGGFDPLPISTDVFAGNKTLNDGFGKITLHTEAGATFANDPLPGLANFYGIIFNAYDDNGQLVPQHRLRTKDDLVTLSSDIKSCPVIITGFMSDASNAVHVTDANYEYVQLMATRDINFSQTPFSLVINNNATASTPTGYPANGWATGDKRSFKFNLTSGFAAKGTFFYVGGSSKLINGRGSDPSMTSANWIRSFDYSTTNGDGFGTKTTNVMSNGGAAFGIAVFEGTNVTAASKPMDVVWVGSAGNIYTAGPPVKGYRIANTDYYDEVDPITLAEQPFFRSGSNTQSFPYNPTAGVGAFNMLGGTYNPVLGRWTKARVQTFVLLGLNSTLSDIETGKITTLEE